MEEALGWPQFTLVPDGGGDGGGNYRVVRPLEPAELAAAFRGPRWEPRRVPASFKRGRVHGGGGAGDSFAGGGEGGFAGDGGVFSASCFGERDASNDDGASHSAGRAEGATGTPGAGGSCAFPVTFDADRRLYVCELRFPPSALGRLIGAKGRVVKAVQAATAAKVAVRDDGRVEVAASAGPGPVEAARERLLAIAEPAAGGAGATRPGRPLAAGGAAGGGRGHFSHFVCLPVLASAAAPPSDFVSDFSSLRAALLAKNFAADEALFQAPRRLHVTVCMLALDTPAAEARAAEVFRACQAAVYDAVGTRSVAGAFAGLHTMRDSTLDSPHLVTKPEPTLADLFRKIAQVVCTAFWRAGVLTVEELEAQRLIDGSLDSAAGGGATGAGAAVRGAADQCTTVAAGGAGAAEQGTTVAAGSTAGGPPPPISLHPHMTLMNEKFASRSGARLPAAEIAKSFGFRRFPPVHFRQVQLCALTGARRGEAYPVVAALTLP